MSNQDYMVQEKEAKLSLAGLSPDVRRVVVESAEKRPLKRNQVLFQEGDPAKTTYILQTGAAAVRKSYPPARQQVTGFLFPGDLAGSNHARHYSYSVRLLSAAEVLCFERSVMDTLWETYPEFGAWLLRMACSEMAEAQEHMLLLGRKTARERIASFLLRIEARLRRKDSQSDVWLPMRRGEIAEHLGVSLETVSRVMSEFARQGLILPRGRHLVRIQDRRYLTSLAEGAENDGL